MLPYLGVESVYLSKGGEHLENMLGQVCVGGGVGGEGEGPWGIPPHYDTTACSSALYLNPVNILITTI